MNPKPDWKVLVADDDPLLSKTISQFLAQANIKTQTATNGQMAFELFEQMKPDVIVADLCMPVMGGLDLLFKVKNSPAPVPVIIMTGNPDMPSAIKAMQDGAYDYVLKPLHLPVLLQKIRDVLEKSRLARENIILTEIVSLYNITSKLAQTHNLDVLLDIIFRYALEEIGAGCGAIFLREGQGEDLVHARQKGQTPLYDQSSGAETLRHSVAQRAFLARKPVIIVRGVVQSGEAVHPACCLVHALIAMPITVQQESLGVIIVEREPSSPPFSALDFNRMEILASQAGIAINNATLHVSLKQKLEELKLISAFSEQLMGRMDKYDLARSLCEKVSEQCLPDIVCLLLVQKPRNEFLYWTRGSIEEADLWNICRLMMDNIRADYPPEQLEHHVSLLQLMGSRKAAGRVRLPLAVQHIVPITWEGITQGAFFMGASVSRPENNECGALVSGLVNQIRIALVNTKLYNEMKENYLKTIKALATAVDAKDNYTRGHSEKVMELAEELAREIREFDDKRVAIIRDAALLHDIGKIGIPGHILNKNGPLTFEEFHSVMKNHSVVGANIVKEVPFLNQLYKLILHHHEHYDGTGYPEGLRGEEIPLGARVLHIADAFDAMTSDRPYRAGLGKKEALRRIVADRGKHFDPQIVTVLLRVARRKGIIE